MAERCTLTDVQGTAFWYGGYVIPLTRFVPTLSEVFNDDNDKHVSLLLYL